MKYRITFDNGSYNELNDKEAALEFFRLHGGKLNRVVVEQKEIPVEIPQDDGSITIELRLTETETLEEV